MVSDVTGSWVGDPAQSVPGLWMDLWHHRWFVVLQVVCEVTGPWVGVGAREDPGWYHYFVMSRGDCEVMGPKVVDGAGAFTVSCGCLSCQRWFLMSQEICEVIGLWVGDGAGAGPGISWSLWWNRMVSHVTGDLWRLRTMSRRWGRSRL